MQGSENEENEKREGRRREARRSVCAFQRDLGNALHKHSEKISFFNFSSSVKQKEVNARTTNLCFCAMLRCLSR